MLLQLGGRVLFPFHGECNVIIGQKNADRIPVIAQDIFDYIRPATSTRRAKALEASPLFAKKDVKERKLSETLTQSSKISGPEWAKMEKFMSNPDYLPKRLGARARLKEEKIFPRPERKRATIRRATSARGNRSARRKIDSVDNRGRTADVAVGRIQNYGAQWAAGAGNEEAQNPSFARK